MNAFHIVHTVIANVRLSYVIMFLRKILAVVKYKIYIESAYIFDDVIYEIRYA